MPADLTTFEGHERRHVQLGLMRATKQAITMEEAAVGVCRVLYEELAATTPDGMTRACSLVRCFKTHPFGSLDPELQRAAESRMRDAARLTPSTRCMTLLASMGDRPEWRSRHTSRRFRCIPVTHETLGCMPMWKSAFHQSGLEIPGSPAAADARGGEIVQESHRSYNVFCVEHALGSSSVPEQQDFVVPFRIASVFGFGGQLRRGDVYVVLLFTRVPVTREIATRVNGIALDVTSTFFRFGDDEIFIRPALPASERGAGDTSILR